MQQHTLLIIILIICIVLLFLMFRIGYVMGINSIHITQFTPYNISEM